MSDTMHEAWKRVQNRLPNALSTPESLWLHPDGTVYLDDYARYEIDDTGDEYRIRDTSDPELNLPLTEECWGKIGEHIIADAFDLLKDQSGLDPEQADKCLAPGPLYGAHSLCWFGPGPEGTWGRVLTDLDKALTLDRAIKEVRQGLSALAIEHGFADLRRIIENRAIRRTDGLWLSGLDYEAEAVLELIEDDTGVSRFVLYLTANLDGSARVRFLDDGGMNYLSFRAGTSGRGLDEDYGDVVDAVRAVLDRFGGRD